MGHFTGGERGRRERRKRWETEFANNLVLESANDDGLPQVKGKSTVEKFRFVFKITKNRHNFFSCDLNIYFDEREDESLYYSEDTDTCEESAHYAKRESVDCIERVYEWRGEERGMFDTISSIIRG